MKIFRSEDVLFDQSLRTQVLELFLFAVAGGKPYTPMFEDLLVVCEDEPTKRNLLDVVVGLLDDHLLVEGEDRRLLLVRPNEAMVQVGFFTEDTLDLVPEGVKVFCLADRIQQIVDEKGADAAAVAAMVEISRGLN